MSAEGFSVKLRGKLALAGILSGCAFLTYTLVKRDRRATEILQSKLGPAEQIIQIERGFNQWDIHYYREHAYFFLNNRFIKKKTNKTFFLNRVRPDFTRQSFSTYRTSDWDNLFPSFSLTYTPVSANPRWLSLYPLHQPPVPQSAISYLHLLEAGHLPDLLPWHLRLR